MTTTDEREQYINELKANIKLADSLTILRNTPEWVTIIKELFCDTYLKSNVYMLTQVSSADGKNKFVSRIEAVSHFQQFIEDIILKGQQASNDLTMLIQETNNGN